MMEKDNPGYVYAYAWNRRNMGLVGGWPEDNQNIIVRNCAWIYALIVLLFIWLPMSASVFFLSNSLSELINAIVVNGPVVVSIYKLWLFRAKREVMVDFLCAMARDWAEQRTNEEMEAMMRRAKWTRLISAMSILISSTMCLTFTVVGTYEAYFGRRNMANDSVLAVGFLYPAYFPFDTVSLYGYLPLMIAQYWGTVVSIVGYFGPDSLMAMIMLHLVGQLETVKIALNNIVDEKSLKDPSIYWKRFSTIVQKHEELNRRAGMIEDSFNFMLLVQVVNCSILFCFQGYVIITTFLEGLTGDEEFPFLQMMFFICFASTGIIHLFVYCWASDLLVVESTSLSYAAYESQWYLLKPNEARSLMMLTYRARIPLEITAGKFVGFSLELFTTIMKTSMGYLSVLLAVEKS